MCIYQQECRFSQHFLLKVHHGLQFVHSLKRSRIKLTFNFSSHPFPHLLSPPSLQDSDFCADDHPINTLLRYNTRNCSRVVNRMISTCSNCHFMNKTSESTVKKSGPIAKLDSHYLCIFTYVRKKYVHSARRVHFSVSSHHQSISN